MQLENEFTVAAGLDQTWETLLDIERVATCLPGATIESSDEDGVYHGVMKMKLGPMNVSYRGTARLQEVDEDSRTASIVVEAREARGQGTAAAVISNQLEAVNGRTKVVAVTDLQITGRQAQFGRGIMEDVASSMMKQFAERLEWEIQNGTSGPAAADAAGIPAGPTATGTASKAAASSPSSSDGADDVLDVGGVIANTELIRYALPAGAAALVLILIAVLWGRRPSYRFTVNLKR